MNPKTSGYGVVQFQMSWWSAYSNSAATVNNSFFIADRRKYATRRRRLPAGFEEGAQEIAALAGQDAGNHVDGVVEVRRGGEPQVGVDRARLRIGGAVDQLLDARVDHGPDAHRARLDRDHDDRPGEPVVAEAVRRAPQREDLGVGGGVAQADRVVVRAPDDLVVDQDDSADRHLSFGPGVARFGQGCTHPQFRGRSV